MVLFFANKQTTSNKKVLKERFRNRMLLLKLKQYNWKDFEIKSANINLPFRKRDDKNQ
jgi:hypothetical protein